MILEPIVVGILFAVFNLIPTSIIYLIINYKSKQLVPFWDIYVGLTIAYAIISIFFV